MRSTTKTGLIASRKNKLIKREQPPNIQLNVIATCAPYVLKPYAGLYNPYPYRCSLLCNHPADLEARELLKKAKDSWAHDGKNLLLTEEIEAIRSSLNQLHVRITDYDELTSSNNNDILPSIECVPEELFRRYTETDSRPMTPAPTLMSAHTRASGTRRCITPDPMNAFQVREKTTLVLDLRRSHSQETLSWHSSNIFQREEIPSITILKVNSSDRRAHSATTFSEISEAMKKKKERANTSSVTKLGKSDQEQVKTYLTVNSNQPSDNESEIVEEDEEFVKRRGRKRRKRLRDGSRDLSAVQSSIDPETQIATIGPESHNPSARPSLIPTETIVVELTDFSKEKPKKLVTSRQPSFIFDSYLDVEMIKLLRRELDEEVIDNEFNVHRRLALEEAFKTLKPDEPICDDLVNLKNELILAPASDDLLLNVPRKFTRSSVRFELPMDSREFNVITPLEYLKEYSSILPTRKKLYNFVFNRNKMENDIENEGQRRLLGKNVTTALNEVMGRDMTDEQASRFKYLVGWKDEEKIDFKTFCGISALCERILAPEYCPELLDKQENPCQKIEIIDFQSLDRRLNGKNPDERLLKILQTVKDA